MPQLEGIAQLESQGFAFASQSGGKEPFNWFILKISMLLAQGASQAEALCSRHGCVVPLKALETAEGAVSSGVVPDGLWRCCSHPKTNSEVPVCW